MSLIGKSVDVGGAVTTVTRQHDGGKELLVVDRWEDVGPVLERMKAARDNEERKRLRDDSMNMRQVAEIPATVLMEMAKKHGYYHLMPPHVSGCADRKEMRKRFAYLMDNYYPEYKATNKRLS